MRFDVVQFLRCLLLQQGKRLGRELQSVLLHHSHGLGTGAAVGVGRPAGDAVQRVTQNVTEDDTEYLRRLAGESKASALYGGEPLADTVHLHNVGTAGQQLAGNVRQFLTGNQGKFEEGAAAAGEQKDHRIISAETLNQVQRFFCC